MNHGTPSGYTQGCRQACCQIPHTFAAQNYRDAPPLTLGRIVKIEQAIARGVPASRIMADFTIPYATYRALLDAMNPDPEPVPVGGRLTVGGRPVSSYFGPAAPEVIEELIDAVMPRKRQSRRRESAA